MSALTGPAVVQERVRAQLERIPGEVSTGQNGSLLVSRGTRVTAVQVIGLQPDVTLVVVFAVVATDVVELDGACRFLATRGLDLPLVHFELVDDGKALIAVHGLLGEFVSGPDLVAAVDAVGDAAETLGPEVSGRFGGALLALATPVEPATPDWLHQPVRVAPSAQPATPDRPAHPGRRAAIATYVVAALVAAAWVLWGAGSALAVALVLGPLVGAVVIAPALRDARSTGRTR
jgi:hypothetical protein